MPQYCYAIEACAKRRLAGGVCQWPDENSVTVAQGLFEPVVCTPGYYCPVGAKEQTKCPSGSYCPPGSEKAIACGGGSRCPEGSQNEIVLIPLALLIVLDVLLILSFILLQIRARRRPARKVSRLNFRRQSPLKDLKEKKAGYESLDDDVEGIALESIIRPLKRVPTGFQAALDQQYLQGNENPVGLDIESNMELRHFVDSMRKAIQGSVFGITFDFRNLSYQPRGPSKPILSQVSGSIGSGSLVGIMGGSGAGKCVECVQIVLTRSLTRISNLC